MVRSYQFDLQFGQDGGENHAQDIRSSSTPLLDPGQVLRQRDHFLANRAVRKVSHRGVEVPQELISINRMLNRKSDQFIDYIILLLGAGVLKGGSARDHVVGDSAETTGNLDAKLVARSFL